MAGLRRLVCRLWAVVRRRLHSRKPIPVVVAATKSPVTQAQTANTTSIPVPSPPATVVVAQAIEATLNEQSINTVQIQHRRSSLQPPLRPLPPITRSSESVVNAPVRTSIDEAPCIHTTSQRLQQQQLLSIQPPNDEIRKQALNDVHRLSPGEWDWSSRPSRCNSVSSAISSSRESCRSKASTGGESLSAQLRSSRVVYHHDQHSYFIPRSEQQLLITIPNIEKDIYDRDVDHVLTQADIQRIAEEAFNTAPQLFAILACLKRGPDIRFFLDKGISDKDLPFQRMTTTAYDGKGLLQRKSGEVIEELEGWDDGIMENFVDTIQWQMLAPLFKDKNHHHVDDSMILPFMRSKTDPDMEQEREGGFGEVYPARIHQSHYDFGLLSDNQAKEKLPWHLQSLLADKKQDDGLLVAVKQLYSTNEIEFSTERDILLKLDSNGIHAHRIPLLFTFKHIRKYHLVFPYAEANLKVYWRDRPLPRFDRVTVHWVLKQMQGLADALLSMHDFSAHWLLDEEGKVRSHKDNNAIAAELEHYVHHGDIKPENVLWFRRGPGNGSGESSDDHTEEGILKLADFGLSRLHGRGSRSNVPRREVAGYSTYEPPECDLPLTLSRAYDIWSLGCLYLELITWLLEGFEAIERFSRIRSSAARRRPSNDTTRDDDRFFSIINGVPVIRQEVYDWVERLHKHERCSALIHELLKIIVHDFLHPIADERAEARWVVACLHTCLDKADKDEKYLLESVPRPQQSDTVSSWRHVSFAPMNLGNIRAAQRLSVSSENEEKALAALERHLKLPKDLLGRIKGTPSRRVIRSATFEI